MELTQQLHAVEKAIANAKKELIKDHIHHCMEETSESMPREIGALIKEFQGLPSIYSSQEVHHANSSATDQKSRWRVGCNRGRLRDYGPVTAIQGEAG